MALSTGNDTAGCRHGRNGLTALLALLPTTAWAMPGPDAPTGGLAGELALLIFVAAYLFAVGEEYFVLRKSKPMIVAAGLIWLLTALAYALDGRPEIAAAGLQHSITEFAELFLFLLSAMTFITTLEEREVFGALRSWLVSKRFSLRQVYWITGALAFFISPLADNLSTALLMGAVVLAVGDRHVGFITVGCINIVVAANAGGAFSPFGDITTLMVWQDGVVPFTAFGRLFLPALINWLTPALLMYQVVEKGPPAGDPDDRVGMKPGALVIMAVFLATILLSVVTHSQLGLPPALGMMTGLGVLKLYGYWLSRHEPGLRESGDISDYLDDSVSNLHQFEGDPLEVVRRFHIFHIVERASWDTLMFFYGVVLAVGGLAQLGYLALLSHWFYGSLGATTANLLVGVLSAVIDNIPVMLAVLRMEPEMGTDQWLLVTLTAGVGGSMLSVGSAAGVALMGQAQGVYTFMKHLRWSWAVLLGYVLSVACHLGLSSL